MLAKHILGGVIRKYGMPIVFYSHKLTPAQINYTNIEIEQINIVEMQYTR